VDVAEQMSMRRENSISFEKAEMKEEAWDRLDTSMRRYYEKKRISEKCFNFKIPGIDHFGSCIIP
jgi:hypothetical protein